MEGKKELSMDELKNISGGNSQLMGNTDKYANIDMNRCVMCGVCVNDCNSSAIILQGDGYVVSKERCTGCGMCADLCPIVAISMITR